MARQDIFEMLKKEHTQVKELLNEILDGRDTMSETQLRQNMDRLEQDLQIHMQVEEGVIYPELARLEDLKDSIQDAVEEHQELREALGQVSRSHPEEETLRRVIDMIGHHVREEETEVFPTARRIMDEKAYEEMSREAIQRREELKSKAKR